MGALFPTDAYAKPMSARELTADEKAVLELMLTRPFPGRDELRAQLPHVRATGLSCGCGCPSIALQVDRAAPHAHVSDRTPADAFGRDGEGNLVFVVLFVEDGYLSELEFTDMASTSSTGAPGFPALDSLRLPQWQDLPGGGQVDVGEAP